MKIVSFNINGVRARPHQIQQLVETQKPDVIGFQETKVDDPQFPVAIFEELGYKISYFGQKSHYGVALAYKADAISIKKGFPNDTEEDQKRWIIGEFATSDGKSVHVCNGYFPQGESIDHPTKFPAKRKFYNDLMDQLANEYDKDQHIIVMGDFNISPEDKDIGIGEPNRKRWLKTGKCSFQPEEREWFERLKSWGFKDTFRILHPEVTDRFSWFDYRSKGFADTPKRGLRIDTLLATESLNQVLTAADVDYDIRGMEKPSDHAPVWAEFDLEIK
jgi:exodeoxyribonuclease-3